MEREIVVVCEKISSQNELILKRFDALDSHLSLYDKYASEHFNFFYNPNTVHIVEKDKRQSKVNNVDKVNNNNQSLVRK
ncbi:hypothetical protein [Capybara microvirus Cap1_SP_84]|nr:hypothetical protein [Capybara microvirus Cap1_SP_84]